MQKTDDVTWTKAEKEIFGKVALINEKCDRIDNRISRVFTTLLMTLIAAFIITTVFITLGMVVSHKEQLKQIQSVK